MRLAVIALLVAPLVVVLGAAPGRAEDGALAPADAEAGDVTGMIEGRVLRLRIADVGRLALRNSPEFRARMLDPAISRTGEMEALGEFDPLFSGGVSFARDRSEVFFSPSSFTAAGGGAASAPFQTQDTIGGDVGLRGVEEWGGTWTVGYAADSVDRRGAASISTLSPRYSGLLSLGYTHPLLRGAGREVRLSRVREAERRTLQAEEALARTADLIVLAAEMTYWDLVNAYADRDVIRSSIALARELVDVARARVDAGRGIPVDVAEAVAGLARRQGELIETEARIGNLSDRLREYVLPFDGPDADLGLGIEPVDAPVVDLPAAPADPDRALLEETVALRGDARAAMAVVDAARLAEMRAQNDREIELNAVVMGGLRGLESGFSGSSRQIGDGDSHLWEAGVEVSVPIGNVAADARLLRAERVVRQAERNVAMLRNSIIRDVRESTRNVRAALERISAARRERDATREQLAAERSRLDKGRSTPFQLLEVEEDFSRAEAGEIGARVAFEKARVSLAAAHGRLLAERGLVVPPDSE